MSIFKWRGLGTGTKTDIKDGRNWVNESDTPYAQARYPGSTGGTDDIEFDSAVTYSPTSNTDISGGTALNSIKVSKLFNGAIGLTNTYFKASAATVIIDAKISDILYLNLTSTDVIFVNATNCKLNGTIANLQALKGTVECIAGLSVTNSLKTAYINNPDSDVTLLLNAGITLPNTVDIGGGVVTNYNNITNLKSIAGSFYQKAGTIGTLTSNTLFYFEAGTVTNAYLYNSTFDASITTLTKAITNLFIYPSANLNLNDGVGNCIVSNYNIYGGNIEFAPNTKLKPA